MKKGDFIVLAAILAAEAILLFFALRPAAGGAYAVVSVDGETVLTVPFDAAPRVYTVQGALGPVDIEAGGGRARFLHADCPDQVCVKSGWLSLPGRPAACVPNGVLLVVEGESQVDVVLR